jgi:hypothetical protein
MEFSWLMKTISGINKFCEKRNKYPYLRSFLERSFGGQNSSGIYLRQKRRS